MYFLLLKKELKHFLRSKSNIIMLFVFPIVLITTLSVGLKDIMNNQQDIFNDDSSIVYYTIEDGSQYQSGFNQFKDAIESELNIKFEQTASRDDVINDVDKHDAIAHIYVNKDGFDLYSAMQGQTLREKIFRSIFDNLVNQYSAFNTIGKYNPQALQNIVKSEAHDYVQDETDKNSREVSSSEYYTFAELGLIILYISITVGYSVFREINLRTIDRIRLSKVKESLIIFSKVSFGILIGIAQIILVYAYSSVVLGVNWGAHTIEIIALFIALAVFASSIGAVLGSVCKKEMSVNSILQVAIVIICALGGAYTPLSVVLNIPGLSKAVFISPIYWIDVATSSMMLGIKTSAYTVALIMPIVLSIICTSIYLIAFKGRGKLAND